MTRVFKGQFDIRELGDPPDDIVGRLSLRLFLWHFFL